MSDGYLVHAIGMEECGYGRFPSVLTSLEFERLINAGGPKLGAVERPVDRRVPRIIGTDLFSTNSLLQICPNCFPSFL